MADWLTLIHRSAFRQSVGASLCPAHQIPVHVELIDGGPVGGVLCDLSGLHIGTVVGVLSLDNLLCGQGSSLGLAKFVELAHIFQRSDNITVLCCAIGNGNMISGHAHCSAHGQCAECSPYLL